MMACCLPVHVCTQTGKNDFRNASPPFPQYPILSIIPFSVDKTTIENYNKNMLEEQKHNKEPVCSQ
jgi:hypothetical protein